MVILRTRNKITDFLMILAWASPFNLHHDNLYIIDLNIIHLHRIILLHIIHLKINHVGSTSVY